MPKTAEVEDVQQTDETEPTPDTTAPNPETLDAIQSVMAKHGRSFQDGHGRKSAKVEVEDTEDQDGENPDADDDTSTRDGDEPTLPEWTKAQQAAIASMKVSEQVLSKMDYDERTAFVNRLVKIREGTIRALAKGKDKLDPDNEDGESDTSDDDDLAEFTDDDWGSEEGLKKLNALLRENKELKAERQQNTTQANYATLDRFLTALPVDIKKLFGDTPTADLEENSPEYEIRMRLAKKAKALRTAAITEGESMLPEEALEEALAIVAKDRLLQAAERKTTRKLRSESRTFRPSADESGARPADGEDTLSALARIAKAHGRVLPHS